MNLTLFTLEQQTPPLPTWCSQECPTHKDAWPERALVIHSFELSAYLWKQVATGFQVIRATSFYLTASIKPHDAVIFIYFKFLDKPFFQSSVKVQQNWVESTGSPICALPLHTHSLLHRQHEASEWRLGYRWWTCISAAPHPCQNLVLPVFWVLIILVGV